MGGEQDAGQAPSRPAITPRGKRRRMLGMSYSTQTILAATRRLSGFAVVVALVEAAIAAGLGDETFGGIAATAGIYTLVVCLLATLLEGVFDPRVSPDPTEK